MVDETPNVNLTPWAFLSASPADSIQAAQDAAQGAGAAISGQPFDVYRVTNLSNGDVISKQNLVQSGFYCIREKISSAALTGLETDTAQGTYWYDLVANFSTLIVGDVLKLRDPIYGAGATSVDFPTKEFVGICFATHPLLKSPIGARLDRKIQVFRPSRTPNANDRLDSTITNASPLTCRSGKFTLSEPGGQACWIPAGLMPIKRAAKGNVANGIAGVSSKGQYGCYVMPLNGFVFRPNDIILTEQNDHYRVVNPYYQDTGAIGNQLVMERTVSNGERC